MPNSMRTSYQNSKTSSIALRLNMISLKGSLPKGSLNIFHVRRAGRYWGIPTTCPYCDDAPPKELKTTAARRRWQVAHIAVSHVRVRVLTPREEQ